MQTNDQNRLHQLRTGQLWKVEHGYIYIVELGKRLIHYKMLRQPNARAAVTQMIRIEALLNYLRHTEAILVGSDTLALAAAQMAAQSHSPSPCA